MTNLEPVPTRCEERTQAFHQHLVCNNIDKGLVESWYLVPRLSPCIKLAGGLNCIPWQFYNFLYTVSYFHKNYYFNLQKITRMCTENLALPFLFLYFFKSCVWFLLQLLYSHICIANPPPRHPSIPPHNSTLITATPDSSPSRHTHYYIKKI